MTGKIIGVALVGLTQFVLWILLTLLLTTVAEDFVLSSPEMMANNFQDAPIGKGHDDESSQHSFWRHPIRTVGYCLLVLLFGGYLLYSSLFAAVGSAVDQEADTQQFMLPITIPLVLSFIMMQFIIDNPDGSLAYWFSMIPLTSPIIMMVRIPFGVPTGNFTFNGNIGSRLYRHDMDSC